MITEPLPWATTTVFKLIAPTNANIASKMTESLRDIVPPKWKTTWEASYIFVHQCQAAHSVSLFFIDTPYSA
ncbi:MAG: hypothetical protein DMG38_23810 [Acidobacteria bacterium]|nr:MAG: hypothetical protein DMG38_23810 [Acidobacteriota bacterium]